MGFSLRDRLAKLSFRQQFLLVFCLGISGFVLLSSPIITSSSSRSVHQQLVQQGLQITANFADSSTLALLYQSRENAIPAIQSALNFPDVESVAIFNIDGSLLDSLDQAGAPFPAKLSATELNQLAKLSKHSDASIHELDQKWVFDHPVYA